MKKNCMHILDYENKEFLPIQSIELTDLQL
jgi:hypothetical protein